MLRRRWLLEPLRRVSSSTPHAALNDGGALAGCMQTGKQVMGILVAGRMQTAKQVMGVILAGCLQTATQALMQTLHQWTYQNQACARGWLTLLQVVKYSSRGCRN